MSEARNIELAPAVARTGGGPGHHQRRRPGRHGAAQQECRDRGFAFVADPSQQLARMSGEEVRRLIDGASLLFTNEYEKEPARVEDRLVRRRGAERVDVRVTTLGKRGVEITGRGHRPDRRADRQGDAKLDPTGVGDGFRAGFFTARSWGLAWERVGPGRLAARHPGARDRRHPGVPGRDADDFLKRLAESYGPDAAADVRPHLADRYIAARRPGPVPDHQPAIGRCGDAHLEANGVDRARGCAAGCALRRRCRARASAREASRSCASSRAGRSRCSASRRSAAPRSIRSSACDSVMMSRAQSYITSLSQNLIGTGKPSLSRLSTCGGTMSARARRSAYFVVPLVSLRSSRDRRRHPEDLDVEERHPQLERVRHRHLVRLDEDVAAQPREQVDVLHPGRPIEVPGRRVQRAGHVEIRRRRVETAHDLGHLVRAEDARVAVVPLLDADRSSPQQVLAAHARRADAHSPRRAGVAATGGM